MERAYIAIDMKSFYDLVECVARGLYNVVMTVTNFVPCNDTDNDAYGYRGQYVATKGLLTEINTAKKLKTFDNKRLWFDDILRLEKYEVL